MSFRMPRYARTTEELNEKVKNAWQRDQDNRQQADIRKSKELLRRALHKSLYEPKICMGDPATGQECGRFALPGAGFCPAHGGSTRGMQAAAKTRLLCLVEPALKVLNKAMASSDLNLAVKAAQIVLDRAGFHPHATLEFKEAEVDLSTMSTDQLKARANRLLAAMETPPEPLEPEEEEEEPLPDEESKRDPVLDIIEQDEHPTPKPPVH